MHAQRACEPCHISLYLSFGFIQISKEIVHVSCEHDYDYYTETYQHSHASRRHNRSLNSLAASHGICNWCLTALRTPYASCEPQHKYFSLSLSRSRVSHSTESHKIRNDLNQFRMHLLALELRAACIMQRRRHVIRC